MFTYVNCRNKKFVFPHNRENTFRFEIDYGRSLLLFFSFCPVLFHATSHMTPALLVFSLEARERNGGGRSLQPTAIFQPGLSRCVSCFPCVLSSVSSRRGANTRMRRVGDAPLQDLLEKSARLRSTTLSRSKSENPYAKFPRFFVSHSVSIPRI